MLRLIPSLLLCFVLLPPRALSQGPIVPPRPALDSARTYENSRDGLRWQLQDLRNAAAGKDGARLESLIKLTEIPDPRWFTRAFGPDKGDGWSEAYAGNLAGNEKDFGDLMTRLADEDGEFLIRIVNYEPAPAREVERTLIDSLRQPVDIFFASWKKRDSPVGSKSTPVGYFVFLDGRFRWDSAIVPEDVQLVAPADEKLPQSAAAGKAGVPPTVLQGADGQTPYRPGVAGVGYPQCVFCPDPQYSKLARKKRLEGTVLIQAIVQPDGSVTDIKVVKSPDAELSDMAVQGVTNWRMKPARRPDGEPIATTLAIELNFRLLH